ncbi:MAG: response regulator [Desulforhopalus sp.]
MSSIALFNSTFTEEKKIRDMLAAASGYNIIQDDDIIVETSRRYKIDQEKVERTLYASTSVFNQFTHERERNAACLKEVMADHIKGSKAIFSGLITHLIPPSITHVLKVAIFDEKQNRIQRAIKEGLPEKKAVKLVKKYDRQATDWTDFLCGKMASDSSLYDIVIPLGASSPESAVQLIMENYHKPAVMENETSLQAVEDMALGGRVELALIDKGYVTSVECCKGKVTLFVNKSVLNFSRLAATLTKIAEKVDGVKNVSVVTGKDYYVSVYRDQEFSLPPKVLLVDDEQDFVQTLSERLNTRDYGSYPVFNGEQALELLDHETPDVMVLDLKMPGINGVEVLHKTKEVKPEIEIIILTGHGSEEDRKTCMELGAFAYLQKPVDISDLTATIDKAYKKVAAAKMTRG